MRRATRSVSKTPARVRITAARQPDANRLLAGMSRSDRALLDPDLRESALPLRRDLHRPRTAIEEVYFITGGMASVVAISGRNTQVEIGLIGLEGMTGAAVLLGSDQSPHHTYMQIVGSGLTLPVDALKTAIAKSASLGSLMLRYVECFGIQVAHTAVANAKGSLEQRLARWILMACDRVPGEALALTHEFLSLMLGVRRAGVTVSINALAARGVIRSPASGLLEILDREGLEAIAAPFYGVPEREYARLLP